MRSFVRDRVWLLRGLGFAAAACLVTGADGASNRSTAAKKPATPYERAVAAREALEARAGAAGRADYTRVLDDFRAVYHDDPADLHAPDAVDAVAALLAEESRQFEDIKLLRAAIGQYEFLRTQYPASRLRTSALLAEGRIADEGLGDPALARQKFAAVLKEAPRSPEAAEARVAMRSGSGASAAIPSHHEGAAVNGTQAAKSVPRATPAEHDDAPAAEAPTRTPAPAAVLVKSEPEPPTTPKRTSLAQVTGIRHWSTSTYTRVAIDLGDEVTFEAARVPHPDRIYFDLHGAKLGAELVGKSFDVTDDGFLKRIRAAQATGDVTRVVLDVNDVSEYSAFLLPNPYRLIIDIHGGKRVAGAPAIATVEEPAATPVAAGAGRTASAAANSSGLPAMAVTNAAPASAPSESGRASIETPPSPIKQERVGHPDSVPVTSVVTRPTAARPVPNTVAVKAPETASEVASVSSAPGRMDATAAPTSKPIAAVVKLRDDATTKSVTTPTRVSDTRRGAPAPTAVPAKAADKTADGQTSLVRALGLKIGRIVIDAGHGGHDSGTLGVDGIQEKDVVLDVALRLGKLLHERLGAEIIYTRSDDTFIPLETRTAIANKAQADLFLSIHANSSQDETARGVETYYLNFTSDNAALDVAARENAVGGQSIHQLSDLVKKIALKDKIAESREFAADVETSLYAGLEKGNAGLKNRGVKKAPFVVLIGANMPSILAEISFVTNARDAEQLRQPDYRQRVAESLYNGVARYEGGLAGAKAPPAVRASAK